MDEIILREADFKDAEIIYNLSNDKEVRKNSINRSPLDYENHKKWLQLKLADDNYKIYLFFIKKNFIGQVKFDIKSDSAIVGISLSENFRGKGYSTVILRIAIKKIFEIYGGVINIIALIREDNQASVKSFLKSGFEFRDLEKINGEVFLKYSLKKSLYDHQ